MSSEILLYGLLRKWIAQIGRGVQYGFISFINKHMGIQPSSECGDELDA